MKTRSEQEMLELIIGTAQSDDNIRMVILEGSRANPEVPRDPFQDYDIIYAVTTLLPYRNNIDWIKSFGELMILQLPDLMGAEPQLDYKFTYLMQFMDGNRIDLNLYLIDHLKQLKLPSQSRVLIDKDNVFENYAALSEQDYLPRKPSEKEFFECCNEFWWVAPYVAKGLWREQIVYAKYMFEHILREELMKMMTWHFGVKSNFRASPGKHGKNFSKYLEPELCELLIKTYSDADIKHNWNALEYICTLFRKTAMKVAAHFGYQYPSQDDNRVSAYLRHVSTLPKNAGQIY